MKRIWRKIPDFEKYEVSNDGLVRRNGKLRKPTKAVSGHEYFRLSSHGHTYNRSINRLVELTFGVVGPTSTRVPQIPDSDWDKVQGVEVQPIIDAVNTIKSVTAYDLLAKKYSVSIQMIYYIVHGKFWRVNWRAHRQ
jgi:hypothetical protein